jgi:hypothetical protein
MNIYTFATFIICSALSIKAQNNEYLFTNSEPYKILNSTIGISGSSNTVANSKGNYLVSQSIGQASVIGTSSKNGFTLRQGYQQPPETFKKGIFNNSTLNTKVYPNPFKELITIAFSEAIHTDVQVSLFDISGRRLYLETFKAAQVLQMSLFPDSNGIYFLNISANQKKFSTKLIKY